MATAFTRITPLSRKPVAPLRIVARLFGSWGGGGVNSRDAAPSREHQIYADIGHFLRENALDLTPLNFGCAHDYLCGSDRRLVRDVDAALDRQSLSNAWIEDYVARRQSHAFASETMIEIAAKVERELNHCLMLMKQSTDHASGYSESLQAQPENASPQEMIARLAGLTREMIDKTRLAETEMRASHSQVSQLRTTLRAARKASEIDHLTGLPNRRGFERRFAELWPGNVGRPMAVALCDVDHFKAVNDRFGHDTGDRVLKSIACEFHLLKRRGCEVARLGGEEFVILLPNHMLEKAAHEVDRARLKLSGRAMIDSSTDRPIGMVSFSAGVAMIEGRHDLDRAMRLADAALYAAKHAGRNRIYAALDEGQLIPMHD